MRPAQRTDFAEPRPGCASAPERHDAVRSARLRLQVRTLLLGAVVLLAWKATVGRRRAGHAVPVTEAVLIGEWGIRSLAGDPDPTGGHSALSAHRLSFHAGRLHSETVLPADDSPVQSDLPFRDGTASGAQFDAVAHVVTVRCDGTYKVDGKGRVHIRLGRSEQSVQVTWDTHAERLMFDRDPVLTYPGPALYSRAASAAR